MSIKLETGALFITNSAWRAVGPERCEEYLDRHMQGDWGCVCDEDKALNDEAVTVGLRILSAYPIDPAKPHKGYGDNVVWIITEADRTVTTILLPSEY